MKAFTLTPHVATAIWGGRRLVDEYNVQTEIEKVAEAWTLSINEHGQSKGRSSFDGEALGDILHRHKDFLGVSNPAKVPLLKLIDARDDLSLQVHPTAEACERMGKGQAKNEFWLILDCEPKSKLALGFKKGVTREDIKRTTLDDNTLDDSFVDLVHFAEVKKGDIFFVPAGTLHAIGKGILLAEIQQSSDTTYRLFDYNRRDKNGNLRQLHVADALDCLKINQRGRKINVYGSEEIKRYPFDEFAVSVRRIQEDGAVPDSVENFRALLVLDGQGLLTQKDESLPIDKGACVFIPANSGEYLLKCGNANLEVLEIFPQVKIDSSDNQYYWLTINLSLRTLAR